MAGFVLADGTDTLGVRRPVGGPVAAAAASRNDIGILGHTMS